MSQPSNPVRSEVVLQEAKAAVDSLESMAPREAGSVYARHMRTALRALIEWAEQHEHPRVDPPLRSHASYLAEGCRCGKGFCAVHDR